MGKQFPDRSQRKLLKIETLSNTPSFCQEKKFRDFHYLIMEKGGKWYESSRSNQPLLFQFSLVVGSSAYLTLHKQIFSSPSTLGIRPQHGRFATTTVGFATSKRSPSAFSKLEVLLNMLLRMGFFLTQP